MGVKVEVTCAMCLGKVETTLDRPLPVDWLKEMVQSPRVGEASIEETFCCDGCKKNYQQTAPTAHAAAASDYTAKFWSVMNEMRTKLLGSAKK